MTEIDKQKEKIDELGRLVDQYAQSRSLGLWIPLLLIVINAILLVGVIELALNYSFQLGFWIWIIMILAVLWVLLSSFWLQFKVVRKYGYRFYKKEGEIEVEKQKVSIWAWGLYGITFVGPAFLSEFNIMPIRWALAVSLASFGIFMLYLGKKEKEKPLGVVYGLLSLAEGAVTAAGVPTLFSSKSWIYAYFACEIVYLTAAGLITMIVIHFYNRTILRKIKEAGYFGEQR